MFISSPSWLTSVETAVEEIGLTTNFTSEDEFRFDTWLKAIALISINAKPAAEIYFNVFIVYGFYDWFSLINLLNKNNKVKINFIPKPC